MIRMVYAVRDRAVDAFGQPIFVRHAGEALRSFQDEVNNPQSPMNAHPDDYDLYHLGEYDDDLGVINSLERPIMLATGKSMIKEQSPL